MEIVVRIGDEQKSRMIRQICDGTMHEIVYLDGDTEIHTVRTVDPNIFSSVRDKILAHLANYILGALVRAEKVEPMKRMNDHG